MKGLLFLTLGLVACAETNTAGTTEEGNALADNIILPPATSESSSSLVSSSSSWASVVSPGYLVPKDTNFDVGIEFPDKSDISDSITVNPSTSGGNSGYFENPIIQVDTVNFDLWNGDQAEYCVNTGIQNGENTCGFWYSYADNADGGASNIRWPVEMGNSYSEGELDPVIEMCGGVCGTFTLDKGTSEIAIAGIAFNVALNEDGEASVADVSDWSGICVAYSSDAPVDIVLSLGDEMDAAIGYDCPRVHLPKSSAKRTECVTWNSFKQYGAPSVSSTDASQHLYAIRFEFQGESGTTGQFNISAVGTYKAGN